MSDGTFRCDRCGLSDVGYARFVALGFDPHPCDRCREHFEEEGQ